MMEGVLWCSVSSLATTTEERYRQAIDRELAEFERREREFMAGSGKKERTGSACCTLVFGRRLRTSCHKMEIKVGRDHKLAFVTPPFADPRSWPLHVRQLIDF